MAISRRLLSEINIAGDDDRLVPPIDLAGTYYTAANQGDPLKLLQTLFTMVEEVQTAGTTPVHSSLAALCGLLERRPMPRILAPPRPLIVSTNFDLLMERALLLAGISFTRVVQHRSAAKIEINEYQVSRQGRKILFFESESDDPAGGAARRIATREVDENDIAGPAGLDERILNHGRRTVVFETGGRADAARNPLASLSLRALDDREARRGNLGPVLYKCHGSQDIDGSYAASADQYYEYVRDTVKSGNIPEQLLTQIKDSSILFLGYGFLDPAFRLVYNTLLFDRVRKPENKLYAVRLSPQSQRALATQHGSSAPSIDPVEEVIWDDLKELASTQMGIKTVDTDELAFVKRLSERIAESFPQVAHS
jgi:hypothetical protein